MLLGLDSSLSDGVLGDGCEFILNREFQGYFCAFILCRLFILGSFAGSKMDGERLDWSALGLNPECVEMLSLKTVTGLMIIHLSLLKISTKY
jgi:hypothetical protein